MAQVVAIFSTFLRNELSFASNRVKNFPFQMFDFILRIKKQETHTTLLVHDAGDSNVCTGNSLTASRGLSGFQFL
jgi:hypothetical protein